MWVLYENNILIWNYTCDNILTVKKFENII